MKIMKKILMILAGMLMVGALSAQESKHEVVLEVRKGNIIGISGDTDAYERHREFIDSRFIPKDKGEFRVIIEEHMEADTLNRYYVAIYKGVGGKPKLLVKYVMGEEDKKVIGVVDHRAKFRGQNESAFPVWVNGQLRFPSDLRDLYIQGPVKTRFCVGADGKVSRVLIIKSNYPSLDREAFRVVSKSPRWTPAVKDGKPVEIYYDFPIHFILEN